MLQQKHLQEQKLCSIITSIIPTQNQCQWPKKQNYLRQFKDNNSPQSILYQAKFNSQLQNIRKENISNKIYRNSQSESAKHLTNIQKKHNFDLPFFNADNAKTQHILTSPIKITDNVQIQSPNLSQLYSPLSQSIINGNASECYYQLNSGNNKLKPAANQRTDHKKVLMSAKITRNIDKPMSAIGLKGWTRLNLEDLVESKASNILHTNKMLQVNFNKLQLARYNLVHATSPASKGILLNDMSSSQNYQFPLQNQKSDSLTHSKSASFSFPVSNMQQKVKDIIHSRLIHSKLIDVNVTSSTNSTSQAQSNGIKNPSQFIGWPNLRSSHYRLASEQQEYNDQYNPFYYSVHNMIQSFDEFFEIRKQCITANVDKKKNEKLKLEKKVQKIIELQENENQEYERVQQKKYNDKLLQKQKEEEHSDSHSRSRTFISQKNQNQEILIPDIQIQSSINENDLLKANKNENNKLNMPSKNQQTRQKSYTVNIARSIDSTQTQQQKNNSNQQSPKDQNLYDDQAHSDDHASSSNLNSSNNTMKRNQHKNRIAQTSMLTMKTADNLLVRLMSHKQTRKTLTQIRGVRQKSKKMSVSRSDSDENLELDQESQHSPILTKNNSIQLIDVNVVSNVKTQIQDDINNSEINNNKNNNNNEQQQNQQKQLELIHETISSLSSDREGQSFSQGSNNKQSQIDQVELEEKLQTNLQCLEKIKQKQRLSPIKRESMLLIRETKLELMRIKVRDQEINQMIKHVEKVTSDQLNVQTESFKKDIGSPRKSVFSPKDQLIPMSRSGKIHIPLLSKFRSQQNIDNNKRRSIGLKNIQK